ncbi:isoprenylcysteine carboxylmethyltransferase family protein [Mycobacterium sp. OTB74]|uniref:methyltransferase family protein n=1 Tax=Mycobacterium sp. OTB74 TaxID=1853452 RepID=UPI0024753B92|nr:isoprenylcysteine carboxylmethyltransferase family protein [Mycobacterium sp. OTB74]MDH6244574.1 protein-S-isoprenylcysteine O-methyltransferase Ste14 [Mycobacterium sp. OTB74]
MKLALQTLASGLFGTLFFVVLLCGPAGTLHYWQAWVFIAVFMLATLGPSMYLAVKHPDALARRMNGGPGKETRPVQKLVMWGILASVTATAVVSALDWRFGWSHVPTAVVILGNVVVGVSLVAAQWVVIQNNFAGASISVEADQPVISTGLYGVVRHPMYICALIMMVATPPALGSYWGLIPVIASVPILTARIFDEEKLLRAELPGYTEYAHKVRYRLIPYIW